LPCSVEVRLTGRTVEIFVKGERIAVHMRSSGNGKHTTAADHMPSSVRLRTAPPSGDGVQRRPRRSIRLGVFVALAPSSRSSPERSSPSACNRRTSVASRSGSGDETTSANVARNPPASVSESSIVRSSGIRRIATGSPQKRPGPGFLCVDKATKAILFPPQRRTFFQASCPLRHRLGRTCTIV